MTPVTTTPRLQSVPVQPEHTRGRFVAVLRRELPAILLAALAGSAAAVGVAAWLAQHVHVL